MTKNLMMILQNGLMTKDGNKKDEKIIYKQQGKRSTRSGKIPSIMGHIATERIFLIKYKITHTINN
jgi:hypothetical protein